MNAKPALSLIATALLALAVPGSLQAAPSGGRVGWRRVPAPSPSEQGNYLTALATISPGDIWAVGAAYRPISTPGTLTEHWDGSAWRVVPSPNFNQGYNELYGVSAVSASDVWAVGYHNIALYGSEKTMALHWNGAKWSIVPTRNIGEDANELRAVAAVASDDVWAVGFGASTNNQVGRVLIEHWDGARWSLVQSPDLGGGFGILNGVVAIAADDVWAVGSHGDSALVEHWDGTEWSVVPCPNGERDESELYAVSATGPDDVWVVGETDDRNGGDTLVEHWDGTTWKIVPSPKGGPLPSAALNGVVALGPASVWAVGSTYDPVLVDYRTLTEHWDGTRWTIVPSPNPGPIYDLLTGVGGFSGGSVWTVGEAHIETLVLRTIN